jgi:hypothetical protein
VAESLVFWDVLREAKEGFDLSLEIRLKENYGFSGLDIGTIVPQTRTK